MLFPILYTPPHLFPWPLADYPSPNPWQPVHKQDQIPPWAVMIVQLRARRRVMDGSRVAKEFSLSKDPIV